MLIPKQITALGKIVAKNASRYAVTSVRIERHNGAPRALATDGHRALILTWDEPDVADYPPIEGMDRKPVNDYAANSTFTGITFTNTAGAFILNGNRITLGGNVVNNAADPQTVNLDMVLSGIRTFDPAAGDLMIGSALSGTGGLTQAGAGTTTLSGTSGFSGATAVNAGTLLVTGGLSATTSASVAALAT
jgi:autotransporter-associated beta strand protein